MSAAPEVRQVTDVKVLTAEASALGRRMIDVLGVHGPATAGALAQRTDQRAPTSAITRTCSPTAAWSRTSRETAVAQAARSLDVDRHTGHARARCAADDHREALPEPSLSPA
jgi:hypothetical protein